MTSTATDGDDPVVFTPSNEPYLGRPLLRHFDETIVASLNSNERVARYTHAHELSDLQKAACQLIPHGINLALSIRELIRQRYLFAAVVLLRSLVERAGIITYLQKNPDAVEIWKEGWKHGKRPSLTTMLEAMGAGEKDGQAKQVAKLLHSATHGDPIGSIYNLVHLDDHRPGYSVSKSLNDPEICDFVCQQAMCYLIVLTGRMAACFPDALLDDDDDSS